MNTENLYTAIQEIDYEISLTTNHPSNRPVVERLLGMRNRLILKYKPCSSVDWTIQNKKALKRIKEFDWEVQWK
jgi:urate oxidase